MRNEKTMHIDRAATSEMISLLHEENCNAVRAIDGALPEIERAVDMIADRMAKGGRLIYMGAGTSGRLGVIDAASEGAEDSGEAGISDLKSKNLTKFDTVMGISAAGNAAYVADALAYARELGLLTIGLTCNFDSRLATEPDVSIVTDTGAEAITGSTRMKAGTAHKMVLTMLSTAIMIKLGHVYENMMINVKPSNIKLRRRVISIVREILLCDEERAVELLEATEWSIRRAVDANKK